MIYDLTAPAVLATLDAGGPAELAWSPDGQQMALVYPAGEGNAVALWSLDDGRLRVLAQMEAAGRLAWAPDGSKLAFDARTSPGTPTSQGGQPDVYVLYLRSGEIANLTELFLRNNGVDAAQQIGGWAPQWEADSETLRYVRGIPGQIEEQSVMRHTLRSRSPTVVWPVADEGTLGVVPEPGGPGLARVILRDGRDVVQISPAPRAWQDATPGAFTDIMALSWAPAADSADGATRLLLADRQTLWLLDPATGYLSGLAVACLDCIVTQAVWLP
jgi:dipeptidyl aminopeptidase/acylaminoacyl peptidase